MGVSRKYRGVTLTPADPQAYEAVKVTYKGLLVQQGAQEVYAHVGFGEKWDKLNDYGMDKTRGGFETVIPVHASVGTLNMCFRDSAGNWDNNDGNNYSFNILD